MPRLPRPRRATALLGAAALALTVSACGTQGPPEITYYAHGATAVAGPLVLCALDFRSCVPAGLPARLDVPPGDPLQISLPAEIFNAPWRLITIYVDAAGTQRTRDQYYAPGAQLAVTVRPGPGEVLQGVEIQLPSGATDADGKPVARGAWSLQNTYTPHR
ncbi:MAG: DUF2771 family protein [Mycobacteriaceae bacterium]